MYNIGEINQLKVLRKTDIGYLLDGNTEEIFLHFNDSNFMELKEGDLVDAFLYFDNKGRLAATLKTPFITLNSPNILKVVDKVDNLGLFLDMGINKDLLLSKDDLPNDRSLWPKINDEIFVELKLTTRLTAQIVLPNEILMLNELTLGEEKDFFVQFIGEHGLNLYNKDSDLVFVHKSMYRGSYRLGEKVNAKILNHTDNGYTASLIKQKEELRLDDASIIYDYLKINKKMPLTSKSSADDVSKYFEMSRKAFKRALGHLYKEDKVNFDDNFTYLKEDGEK